MLAQRGDRSSEPDNHYTAAAHAGWRGGVVTTAFISHHDCGLHDPGLGHPESPARLKAICARLENSDVWRHLVHCNAPEVAWSAVNAVHQPAYVDSIRSRFPLERTLDIDGDTTRSEFSLDAARRAACA